MAKTSSMAGLAAKALVGAAAAYAKTKKGATKSKVKRGGKRKARSVTSVSTKRKRETYVPQGEYTRNSLAIGKRPRKTLKAAWKLLEQNKTSNVYSVRAYSQFGGVNGSYWLANTSPSTTTGPWNTPLHLWELTSAPNNISSTLVYPNVRWVPQFSTPTDTGALTWSTADALGIENADTQPNMLHTLPLGNDTLDWVQAKLLLYCPTTLPARFQIDVVQFNDTRLVPDNTTGVSTFAAAFWQSMLKRFAFSPLEPGNNKYQKYLKVLHSQTFILNPKETTEAVNTIFREVNVFMRFNRKCTYDWEDQDRMNMLQQEGPTNLDANIKTQVHPRARIFLMIRAQSRNGTGPSSTIHPSYDIVLRMRHSQLSS